MPTLAQVISCTTTTKWPNLCNFPMISQWPSMVSACRRPSPVNCKWGRWNWQSCDVTCGGGTQSGTRRVIQQAANGGMPCSGLSRATRTCNTEDCPGLMAYLNCHEYVDVGNQHAYTQEVGANTCYTYNASYL